MTNETNIDHRKCPVCGEPAVTQCRCMKCDCICKNGHEWHTCLAHNKIVIGASDHSRPTMECSCMANKTKIDCAYTDEIVCPYCGYVSSDSWEYGITVVDFEVDCNECEKTFLCSRCIDVTYSSTKIETPKGD